MDSAQLGEPHTGLLSPWSRFRAKTAAHTRWWARVVSCPRDQFEVEGSECPYAYGFRLAAVRRWWEGSWPRPVGVLAAAPAAVAQDQEVVVTPTASGSWTGARRHQCQPELRCRVRRALSVGRPRAAHQAARSLLLCNLDLGVCVRRLDERPAPAVPNPRITSATASAWQSITTAPSATTGSCGSPANKARASGYRRHVGFSGQGPSGVTRLVPWRGQVVYHRAASVAD
jgi:hypothetical protein